MVVELSEGRRKAGSGSLLGLLLTLHGAVDQGVRTEGGGEGGIFLEKQN